MSTANSCKNYFQYFELIILSLFLICIPNFEALSNIFYGLFLLSWLLNHSKSKHWGGPWRWFDSVILIGMLADIFINLAALYHSHSPAGLLGGIDLLRYSSVLWMISRSSYSPKKLISILIIALLGTLGGMAFAFHAYLTSHYNIDQFNLKTLGQRNHTAIYIDLIFGMVFSFLLAFWQKTNYFLRVLGIIILIILSLGLLAGASRASFGAAFAMSLFLALAFYSRSKMTSVILISLIILASVSTLIFHPLVLQRQEAWEHMGTDPRECIRHTAILTFEQSPLTGFGSHQYRFAASNTHVQAWSELKYPNAQTRPCFGFAPHAHNLYLNTLAEMGLIGFGALLLFLFSWLGFLIKYYPRAKINFKPNSDHLAMALWASASCAFITDTGIGLVNTTIHHAHALLSMLILGLALSYFYRNKNNKKI